MPVGVPDLDLHSTATVQGDTLLQFLARLHLQGPPVGGAEKQHRRRAAPKERAWRRTQKRPPEPPVLAPTWNRQALKCRRRCAAPASQRGDQRSHGFYFRPQDYTLVDAWHSHS